MPGAYLGLKAPHNGDDNVGTDASRSGAIPEPAPNTALSQSTAADTRQQQMSPVATSAINAAASSDVSLGTPQTSAAANDDEEDQQRGVTLRLLTTPLTSPSAATDPQKLSAHYDLPLDFTQRNADQLGRNYLAAEAQRYMPGRPALTGLMSVPRFVERNVDHLSYYAEIENGFKEFYRASGRFAEDLEAAKNNMRKGAVSYVSGLLEGMAELSKGAYLNDQINVYKRIIAHDPSYVWYPENTAHGPMLVTFDQHVHGRTLSVPQLHGPGDDLYEFVFNQTSEQRLATLAAAEKRLDPTDNPLYRAGVWLDQRAQAAFPTTAAQDQNPWTGKVPNFIGKVLPFAFTALATGGAAAALDAPALATAGALLNTAAAATNSANAGYQDAIAHHADQHTALTNAQADAVVATVFSLLPGVGQLEGRLAQFLQPLEGTIGKTATNVLQKTVPTATTGAGIAVAQQASNTAVTKALYDPKRSWFEDFAQQSWSAAIANVTSRLLLHYGAQPEATPSGTATASPHAANENTPTEPTVVASETEAVRPDAGQSVSTKTVSTDPAKEAATTQPTAPTVAVAEHSTNKADAASTPPVSITAAQEAKGKPVAATGPQQSRSQTDQPSLSNAPDDSGKSGVAPSNANAEAGNQQTPSDGNSAPRPGTPDAEDAAAPGQQPTDDGRPTIRQKRNLPILSPETIKQAGATAYGLQRFLVSAIKAKQAGAPLETILSSTEHFAETYKKETLYFPTNKLKVMLNAAGLDPEIRAHLLSNQSLASDGTQVTGISAPDLVQHMDRVIPALALTLIARHAVDTPSLAELVLDYPAKAAARTRPYLMKNLEVASSLHIIGKTDAEDARFADYATMGTNPGAREPNQRDPSKRTLSAPDPSDEASKDHRASYNDNMRDAHAEIESLESANEKGLTQDQDAIMNVVGKHICVDCTKAIARSAERAGLKSLRVANLVREEVNGVRGEERLVLKVYMWRRGDTRLRLVDKQAFDRPE